MVSKIIYQSLFEKSFRWKTLDETNNEDMDMVYCADCDSFNTASYLSEGRYKICCPTCKKKVINVLHKDYLYVKKVYSKIFDKEDKLTFSCAFYHYVFKYDFKKRSFRKMSLLYRYNITYNKITKNIYIVKKSSNPRNNRVANITLGKIPVSWTFIYEHLFYIESDGSFSEFKELLMNQSTDYWEKDHSQLPRIYEMGMYIKYPQVTLLPTEFVKSWTFKYQFGKSLKRRKELEKLPLREKEILHWLTGKKSTRKDRNLLRTEPNLIFLYKLVTTLFENIDTRHEILQAFQQKYELNNIEAYITGANYNGYDFLMEGYFDSTYLSILLEAKRILDGDFNFTKLLIESWGLDFKEDVEKKSLNGDFFTLIVDIQDSARMYKLLKENNADYKASDLRRNREYIGFEKLHNNLMDDYRKLQQKLRTISYAPHEKQKLETTIGNYKFELAKSNHHLAEIGMELNNCVSSYSEDAIFKELYIVIITDINTKKITHCLEIAKVNKTTLRLVQAKANYNQSPTEEDSFCILEYCSQRKIQVVTYDINSEIKQKYKEKIQLSLLKKSPDNQGIFYLDT